FLRPPLQIQTSPLAAIPRGLTSFDLRRRWDLFDYGFTRFLGDSAADHEAACFRVHALFLAARGTEALDSAVGFSFPLCGRTESEWSLDSVVGWLHTQVLEFSHHLGELGVTDLLPTLWPLAKFAVTPPDSTGCRHIVVYFFADTQ
ncbi:hypothetical protein DD594_26800, partial [Enterobacter cloacae complex sp. 4DZ1-17B1]